VNPLETTRYEAPQTEDGTVVRTEKVADGVVKVGLSFELPDSFRQRCDGLWPHVRFVMRSRIARLGIDIRPVAPLSLENRTAHLEATVEAVVQAYPAKRFLSELIVRGMPVGRLVLCDPGKRLTGDAVFQATTHHLFQLPAPISIDAEGNVTIRPHRCLYELPGDLGQEEIFGILTRDDGKLILDRLQLRKDVDAIVLMPGDGVITSCTMFLHSHFVLLDARSSSHGQHLGAVILDPVTTRGTRVFLEFANRSNQVIVNPEVLASIYQADEIHTPQRCWYGMCVPPTTPGDTAASSGDFHSLSKLFHSAPFNQGQPSYENRPFAVINDLEGAPLLQSRPPAANAAEGAGANVLSLRTSVKDRQRVSENFKLLQGLAPANDATVLVEYFPNHIEHLQLCLAAQDNRINKLIFRKASFEHGPFLSARDHGRLADYDAFGLEVIWFNELFEEPALHVYRGQRGFFVPFRNVEAFMSKLVFAIYGSTLSLPMEQFRSLQVLIQRLQELFAGQIALLTGGGPGAMKQAAEIADELGMMAGSNYLEVVDQNMQKSVQFYQTFQGTARHFRQRWFDIASFHIFCIGGVGTMEEIGLTLTDMKLGVIERGPLVFFGSLNSTHYWSDLKRQMDVIAGSHRGPAWLETNVLITDDPDEVIAFYARVLEIGVNARA